ncbi:MAG: VWA domain-containing protein [Pseudomonadota bacterium]
MFLKFFAELRDAGVPVSVREYLTLVEALDCDVIGRAPEEFYHLARTAMVKDERYIDRFDRVFSHVFKGLSALSEGLEQEIPAEWLEKLAEKHLTEEEKAQIEALGGWDKLMETLRERLKEQESRHQGGSKWIGTAGTSPFGAYGYNPEGVRIGQKESRHRRAVKVWDRREFKDLDDDLELGTRGMKIALRRLRKFARTGAAEEFDLQETIRETAHHGYLDVRMRPERRNAIKVLLFLDVGGSMDDHVERCAQLFSAARSEFKSLDVFYFHNCLYEYVWTENKRRWSERTSTHDVLRTFGPDYKVIFVGDASMSPYEILMPGGGVEHFNDEAGSVWLKRVMERFAHVLWINPVPEGRWGWTPSIDLISQHFEGRMVPLTLEGLDEGMRLLLK